MAHLLACLCYFMQAIEKIILDRHFGCDQFHIQETMLLKVFIVLMFARLTISIQSSSNLGMGELMATVLSHYNKEMFFFCSVTFPVL